MTCYVPYMSSFASDSLELRTLPAMPTPTAKGAHRRPRKPLVQSLAGDSQFSVPATQRCRIRRVLSSPATGLLGDSTNDVLRDPGDGVNTRSDHLSTPELLTDDESLGL